MTVGLVLVTLTVATEALIITAIMPVIVRDIGGLQYYGLAFSAFFHAGLASIPAAGWAVDRYGPSTPLAVLIGIFRRRFHTGRARSHRARTRPGPGSPGL